MIPTDLASGRLVDRQVSLPTRSEVARAALQLRRIFEPTPLIESPTLGSRTLLKIETFLPTGSFKIRGAFTALSQVSPGTRVVTASAGNHGLGIVWAARRLGLDVTIVVPETASRTKLRALETFPGTIIQHGSTYDEAERHALSLTDANAQYVSPYNDGHVIAGQGTIALELSQELASPATIICPIGGGGLAAGLGLWASGTAQQLNVIGVESARSAAMRAALDCGNITQIQVRPTLADGLGGNLEKGSVTFDLVRRYLDDVVVVHEDEIAAAIRFLATEHGIVTEGAGAAAVAALFSGRVNPQGVTVALVTGRNIDPELLGGLLGRHPKESSSSEDGRFPKGPIEAGFDDTLREFGLTPPPEDTGTTVGRLIALELASFVGSRPARRAIMKERLPLMRLCRPNIAD